MLLYFGVDGTSLFYPYISRFRHWCLANHSTSDATLKNLGKFVVWIAMRWKHNQTNPNRYIIWHCKNNSDYFWTRVYSTCIISSLHCSLLRMHVLVYLVSVVLFKIKWKTPQRRQTMIKVKLKYPYHRLSYSTLVDPYFNFPPRLLFTWMLLFWRTRMHQIFTWQWKASSSMMISSRKLLLRFNGFMFYNSFITLVPMNLRYPLTLCMSMMTSSNGNIFRVIGPLCGEFIGRRWIPLTKSSDTKLWCFLWSAPEWIVRLVIWNAFAPIMISL